MQKDYYKILVNHGVLKGQVFKVCEGVTYVTGANGAGKTQFFEALKKSHVVVDKVTIKLNGNRMNYKAIDWQRNAGLIQESSFDTIQNLLEEMEQAVPDKVKRGSAEEHIDKNGELVLQERTQVLLHGVPFKKNHISSGTASVLGSFEWGGQELGDAKSKVVNRQNIQKQQLHGSMQDPIIHGQRPLLIYLWDEPENHLHPKEQKKLSQRFEKWIDKIQEKIKVPLVILVATHSPFALRGASDFNHGIICLEKCKVVKQSLDSNDNTHLLVEANKMLGLGLSDVLPAKMVVAENSITQLLNKLEDKFDLQPDYLKVTSGGDDKAITKVEDTATMLNLIKRVSKEWPHRDIFDLNIVLILDDEEGLNKANAVQVDGILNFEKLKIGKQGLEDSFPSELVNEFLSLNKDLPEKWDRRKFPTFKKLLRNHSDVDHTKIGQIKSNLAKYIVDNIESVDQLKKEIPEAHDVLANLYDLEN